jgi:hypothetical protein
MGKFQIENSKFQFTEEKARSQRKRREELETGNGNSGGFGRVMRGRVMRWEGIGLRVRFNTFYPP